MASFQFEGQRIAYTEFGGGPAAINAGALAGGRPRARRQARDR